MMLHLVENNVRLREEHGGNTNETNYEEHDTDGLLEVRWADH